MVKRKETKQNSKLGFLKKINRKGLRKIGYLLLTVLVIGFLAYRFRDKFLAGLVNGEPIFRFQLSERLNSQYGKAVLDDLIIEKLIYQEAKTKKVSISTQEFQEAVDRIKSQLGEETNWDSFLASQGIKKSTFEHQLKTQLLVRKIMEGTVSVSEEEIENYIRENKGQMTATSEADLAAEAKQKLTEEKISTQVNPWISGLLQNGKITRLLR